MSTTQTEHDWFAEQITAYLTGGLTEPEQTRFADHLAHCGHCASKLKSLEKEDQAMQALFASQIPDNAFEQRIIAGLRNRWTPRLVIHPMVRKAAAGVAAVLVLGAMGYATRSMLNSGGLPQIIAGDATSHGIAFGPLRVSNWPFGQKPQLASNNLRFGAVEAVDRDADGLVREVMQSLRKRVDPVGATNLIWHEHGIQSKQADEAIKRTTERQALERNESAPTVPELIRQTRTYIGHDDYTQGLATLDHVLRLDPANAYALSVRPLLEDRATLSQQRQDRERFNVELRKQVNQPEEKKIPYADIYRYPADTKSLGVEDAISPVNKETTLKEAGRAGDVSPPVATPGVVASQVLNRPTDIDRSLGYAVSAGGKSSLTVPTLRSQTEAVTKQESHNFAFADAPSFKPAEFAAGRTPVTVADGNTLLLGGLTVKNAGDSVFYANGHVRFESSKEAGVPILRKTVNNFSQVAAATPTTPQPSGEPAPKLQPAQAVPTLAEQPSEAAAGRKIIRNGAMEFEVDSFDSSFAQVSKIVKEEGGFVASTESEKLSNGKMTGTVVLRVAPEHLDTLVLKLRALGDLKNQKIVAQDITKQYTDLESQLRAARAMEQRLLEIIKTGKGEIKDLVAAEKELGVWREKIEQAEGEIRYYSSQIALSTLKITLAEKDVQAAAFASETELRSIGIETEDVEKSYATAQELVNEFKGRIVGATLKKLDAGQFAANIVCDIAPEDAGPMTDRLKQIGKVVRLEAERKLTTADGTAAPVSSKVQRKDTRFIISLYNLANIAPRETTTVNLACRNVESAYRAILLRVAKAGGRIVGSNLNQPKADQTTATISFQVKTEDADTLLAELRKPANAADAADTEVIRLSTTENPDTANVTTAKRGFAVQIVSLASIAARETINLRLAVPNVPDAYKALAGLLADPAIQSRIISSQLAEQDRQNVTGSLDCEIRRTDLPAFEKSLASNGEVFSRSATRTTDAENTIDSKVRITLTLINAQNLPPRDLETLGIDVANVEKTMGDITAAAVGLKGRSVESRLSKEPNGKVTGRLVIDVPLASAADILTTVRKQGTVRAIDTARNTQVPAGALARTRLEITISNGEGIVASDQGIWATIRRGLTTSVAGLLWSLQLIVIGLFMIGPWLLVLWAAWRLTHRNKRKPSPDA